MRHWPVSLPILAALMFAAAPTAAAKAPHYARSYHGTLKGSFISTGGQENVVESWKITGVVFRFTRAARYQGGWIGRYKVVSGRVSFQATLSGACSAIID